jgi:hypothetical protein
MPKKKKTDKVRADLLDAEDEEDLTVDQDNLLRQLTESRREVRLSDESDYFNND